MRQRKSVDCVSLQMMSAVEEQKNHVATDRLPLLLTTTYKLKITVLHVQYVTSKQFLKRKKNNISIDQLHNFISF